MRSTVKEECFLEHATEILLHVKMRIILTKTAGLSHVLVAVALPHVHNRAEHSATVTMTVQVIIVILLLALAEARFAQGPTQL